MKLKQLLLIGMLIAAFGCKDGYIDDIKGAPQGTDVTAPTVTINYPFEGAKVRVVEDVATININVSTADDIEIESVKISLDGDELVEYTDFIDYRKATNVYQYTQLENGDHELTVVATDKTGKSTTKSVNFTKAEPYSPTYPGEIIYFPFDGDYADLITLEEGTPAGTTTFVDGLKGGKAVNLTASSQSYVLFPGDTLAEQEEFSLSFWVHPEFVDANSDNGIDGILGLVNLSHTSNFWGNIDMFIENGSNPTAGAELKVHVVSEGTSESWITGAGFQGLTTFFGQWSHHVLSYDNTAHQFKYYINGVLVKTAAAAWASNDLNFVGSGNIVLGAVHFMTSPSQTTGSGSQPWASYLTGQLDEVRIFNRALSQSDVTTIYNDWK